MDEEERKRYLKILVEDLYKQLKLVSEGTNSNKKEIAKEMIREFYEENKEDYNIENIGVILEELERINKNIKKTHESEEQEER